MADTRYNTPDLATETSAIRRANSDNIEIEYYNASSASTVKNMRGNLRTLVDDVAIEASFLNLDNARFTSKLAIRKSDADTLQITADWGGVPLSTATTVTVVMPATSLYVRDGEGATEQVDNLAGITYTNLALINKGIRFNLNTTNATAFSALNAGPLVFDFNGVSAGTPAGIQLS